MSKRFDQFIGWQGARHETRIRLLETYCRSVRPKTVFTNVGTVVLLAALMWHEFDPLPLILWVLATSLVGIANRIYVIHLEKHPENHAEPDRRAAELAAMSAVYGLTWGAGPLLFYAQADPLAKAVLVIVVMLASIMSTYAALPGLQMARFIPAALMTVYAIGVHEGPAALIAAALIAFWLFLRSDITRSFHAALRQQLDLQDQLRDQQDKLEQANAAKSDFLAVMSHEIRTPMNGMLGMIDLIDRTQPTGKLATYTRQLKTAGQHLAGLLNNILDFSRLEDHGIEVIEEHFSLNTMVDEVMEIVSPAAEVKGVVIRRHLNPALPERLRGDAGLLRQVLINLLGNAVKFTDTGAVELAINDADGAAPGDLLSFRVTDTGRGIDPDRMAAIFEPFVQEDASTTRTYGGTGLGLTISRRIVDAMSGEITVSSEPGRGTTITVTVPVRAAGDDAVAQVAPPPDPGDLPVSRILMVDDSEFNRMVVRELLADSPCRIDEAADGRQGLDKFKAGTYDVVFSDIRMPEMDGFAFIRALRRHPNGRDIPIVVLTAAAFRADRDQAMQAGANIFMTKPVPVSALLRTLSELLAVPSSTPVPSNDGDTGPSRRLAALLPRLHQRMCEDLEIIGRAAGDGDMETLTGTLHSARGNAGLFGVTELDDVLARMYADVRNDDLPALGASMSIMRDILNRMAKNDPDPAGRTQLVNQGN